MRTAGGCLIDAGLELIKAREECPPGKWLQWLQAEFDWSAETAYKLIRVAEAFQPDGNAGEIEGLSIDVSALYALSWSDVSSDTRTAIITRAKAGEHISQAGHSGADAGGETPAKPDRR